MVDSEWFYILSLKWTREVPTWWGPNDGGYVWALEDAGRYSRQQVEANQSYYNDGIDTMAIPVEAADAAAKRFVPGHRMRELVEMMRPHTKRWAGQ